mmetsp:Transcript_27669/g.56664  ORF Transcript_27669/g.56664 Transcript_27669/m.56664 type:complete len:254 (+) Transcript_27669:618-1379(+)
MDSIQRSQLQLSPTPLPHARPLPRPQRHPLPPLGFAAESPAHLYRRRGGVREECNRAGAALHPAAACAGGAQRPLPLQGRRVHGPLQQLHNLRTPLLCAWRSDEAPHHPPCRVHRSGQGLQLPLGLGRRREPTQLGSQPLSRHYLPAPRRHPRPQLNYHVPITCLCPVRMHRITPQDQQHRVGDASAAGRAGRAVFLGTPGVRVLQRQPPVCEDRSGGVQGPVAAGGARHHLGGEAAGHQGAGRHQVRPRPLE